MFQQRSYSGKSFRPKPIIEQPDSENLVVLTPWGAPEYANQVLSSIKDFLEMSQEAEATVVASGTQLYSSFANRMRSAALMANENLYLNANKSEYLSAVELLALSKQDDLVSWVHIGAPHLFLQDHRSIQPLCYTLDWAWQTDQKSPLLCHGLGVERSVNLNCGTYRVSNSCQFIMISRSYVPASFYTLQDVNLEEVSRVLIEDDPEMPFWLGLLKY